MATKERVARGIHPLGWGGIRAEALSFGAMPRGGCYPPPGRFADC
jgi:hypothetical protein